MNSSEMLKSFKNLILSNTELSNTLYRECEFQFDDSIDIYNEILICGEKSNYNLTPFGKDTMGGVYCLLNNQYVGYITSEGGCGVIARNVKDFFNLLATCKNLTSYLYNGVFDSINSFTKKYEEVNNELYEHKALYDEFISYNGFIVDVEKIFEMFKQGIVTEPSFVLEADPNKYKPWDDLFYTGQQYIEKLRSNEGNYLKRETFINSIDSNKIWSKSMSMTEVKDLLDFLENELLKYNFTSDKNFIMDGRRNSLKTSIEARVSNNDENINEKVLESVFNFWEFVNNEYYTITLDSLEKLHLNRDEAERMCNEYAKSGIICLEEKNVILEMIQMIKKIINIYK